jgi:cold shock CspA family protein
MKVFWLIKELLFHFGIIISTIFLLFQFIFLNYKFDEYILSEIKVPNLFKNKLGWALIFVIFMSMWKIIFFGGCAYYNRPTQVIKVYLNFVNTYYPNSFVGRYLVTHAYDEGRGRGTTCEEIIVCLPLYLSFIFLGYNCNEYILSKIIVKIPSVMKVCLIYILHYEYADNKVIDVILEGYKERGDFISVLYKKRWFAAQVLTTVHNLNGIDGPFCKVRIFIKDNGNLKYRYYNIFSDRLKFPLDWWKVNEDLHWKLKLICKDRFNYFSELIYNSYLVYGKKKIKGEIININNTYGFIKPNKKYYNNGENYFFHFSSIDNDKIIPLIGKKVIFNIKPSEKLEGKYQAKSVYISPNDKIKILHVKDDIKCSICLDIIKEEDKYLRTECNHFFHEKCLNHWLNKDMQKTCPNCRNKIDVKNIYYINRKNKNI